MVKTQDPRGKTIYWIGPPGSEQDAGEETDFFAVKQGYVSITPLQMDLTRYSALESMGRWVETVELNNQILK